MGGDCYKLRGGLWLFLSVLLLAALVVTSYLAYNTGGVEIRDYIDGTHNGLPGVNDAELGMRITSGVVLGVGSAAVGVLAWDFYRCVCGEDKTAAAFLALAALLLGVLCVSMFTSADFLWKSR